MLNAWLQAVAELANARDISVAFVLMGLGQPRADCPVATAERAALFGRIRRRLVAPGFSVLDADAEAARIAAGAGIMGPLNGFGRSLGSGHLNDDGHRVYARLLDELVADFAR